MKYFKKSSHKKRRTFENGRSLCCNKKNTNTMKKICFAFLVALLFWGGVSYHSQGVFASFVDNVEDVLDDAECLLGDVIDIDISFGDQEKPIFDGPGIKKGAKLAKCRLDNGVSKVKNMNRLLVGWMKFFLSVTAVIAVLAIVFAGFLYVTAGGDDGQTEKAKKVVMWVAIGILLIFGSYAIVNTIMQARFGPEQAILISSLHSFL